MALQHSSFTYFFSNQLIISCVCLSICFLDSYFSNTASLTRVPTCHRLEKSSWKNDSMQRSSLSVYTRLTMCPLTCPQRNIEVDQTEQLWPIINLERSSACLINPSVFSGTTVNLRQFQFCSKDIKNQFLLPAVHKHVYVHLHFSLLLRFFLCCIFFPSIIYPALFSR